MVSTKGKESFKKLATFIGIVTLAYLTFIQIASLVYLFSIKEKAVSHGITKEDAPIPAFTLCVKTEQLTRQEVLDKYKVDYLIFDDEKKNIESYWQEFDWDSVSLKRIYNEAVIYPHEIISGCEVGANYNCTKNKGVYHRWENVLKNGYSCSSLRVKKKVPHGEETEVIIKFKSGLHYIIVYFQVHDTNKPVLRYLNKYMDFQHEVHVDYNSYSNVIQTIYKYSIQKEKQLPETEGRTCSEDTTTDPLKCEENCFEKELLEDYYSCVLPWVMSPGRECSSVDEALAMVKKEKEIKIIPCDCQDSCTRFRYFPDEQTDIVTDQFSTKAIIDNRSGFTLLQETYVYTFLDLLANCGGSLSVFFPVSFLWLLAKIIKTVCNCQCFAELLPSEYKEDILGYLLKATSLACLSLFIYEGSHFISKYVQNPKMLTVSRLDPFLLHPPNVVFCNNQKTGYLKNNLDSNYIESLFSNPASDIIECHLDNETCIEDGSWFSWETLYSSTTACSMLRFNATAQYKELQIIFQDVPELYLYLSSSNTISRYGIDQYGLNVLIKWNLFSSVGFSSEQKFNLPPCTENYVECQERCWEQMYLKEDLCSPPEMPPTVKHKPCKTRAEYYKLIDYMMKTGTYLSLCHCDLQCSEMEFQYWTTQFAHDSNQIKLSLSLTPFQFTRTSEKWAYSFNRLIAEIGGMLGVLTGMSFLSVLLDSLLKILAWQSKRCAESSLSKNAWNIVVTLVIWGWVSQQVYTSISHYMESPSQLDKVIDKRSLKVLPSFIICNYYRKVYLYYDNVIAYFPDGDKLIHSYSVKRLDFNKTWYHLEDYLIDCTVFGIPCNQQKGEIHEWHNVSNVNGYCSRLEIKPLKLQHYTDNRLVFTISNYVRFYVLNNEELPLFSLEGFDDYKEGFVFYTLKYTLHQRQYKLLEDKPNTCINRLGYSRRNCLDQCIIDRIVEPFKCRMPYMNFPKYFPICVEYLQYEALLSVNSTFLAGCQCLPHCQHTQDYLNYDPIIDERKLDGKVEIEVLESKEIFKELWSYPAGQCLADLGGLLSLFMGFNLYEVFLSSNSHFLKLWQQIGQFLKFLGVSRLKIENNQR